METAWLSKGGSLRGIQLLQGHKILMYNIIWTSSKRCASSIRNINVYLTI